MWFLILCLLVILGAIGWHFLPWSDEKLMAHAEKLMQTDLVMDKVKARDEYLKLIIDRNPNSALAEKARDMTVDVDKQETVTAMRARVRRREAPINEAEQQFLNAEAILKFGDKITSLRKFRSIIELFKERDDCRVYILLAQDEVDKIRAESSEENLAKFLGKRLKDAEGLHQSGQISSAEEIWTSIKTLYSDNEEATPHVSYAKKRLSGATDAGVPPWTDDEEPKQENSP